MHGLEIRVQLTPDKRREFLQAFEFLSTKQYRSSECIGQSLFEDVAEGRHFLWIEQWTSLKALEDYLKSDQFRSLLGAIEVLGELKNLHLVEFRKPPDNLR